MCVHACSAAPGGCHGGSIEAPSRNEPPSRSSWPPGGFRHDAVRRALERELRPALGRLPAQGHQVPAAARPAPGHVVQPGCLHGRAAGARLDRGGQATGGTARTRRSAPCSRSPCRLRQPSVRATALSAKDLFDSAGQIAGGPVVGVIGTLISIRAALLAGAAAHWIKETSRAADPHGAGCPVLPGRL
jgi:hypothetical protein